MSRFRKILVALSVVAAVSAVSVPASAQQCVEIDLSKYGWNSTNICV